MWYLFFFFLFKVYDNNYCIYYFLLNFSHPSIHSECSKMVSFLYHPMNYKSSLRLKDFFLYGIYYVATVFLMKRVDFLSPEVSLNPDLCYQKSGSPA